MVRLINEMFSKIMRADADISLVVYEEIKWSIHF